MFLLIGFGTEGTFSYFRRYVAEQDCRYDILDLAELRFCDSAEISYRPHDLSVTIGNKSVEFNNYTAFYSRMYYSRLGSPVRNDALSRLISAVTSYLEDTERLVVNRPSAGTGNINKLVHLRTLSKYGFRIPQTFIYGTGQSARQVVRADGKWISKSCSSIKTKAAVLDEALYSKLDNLSVCPSVFQQRIKGADVRSHVVGNEVFSERILSSRIDYRYADGSETPNQYEAFDIPPHIAAACLAYCKDQGLLFAGFDFKISEEDGDWYILEANPMPGYHTYDRRLDQQISSALKKLLAGSAPEPFVTANRRPSVNPWNNGIS